MSLSEISDELAAAMRSLAFSAPVAAVYNPLDYARAPHHLFLERFGWNGGRRGQRGQRPEVLLVGMNPGPWGMAQTGVPFGAVSMVRDWLGIEGEVGRPAREHPKRPVLGFACHREEVSGARLWGWAQELYDTPELFFERFWVTNYCPLLFLDEGGRNLTPDKLEAEERRALVRPCDRALRRVAEHLGVRWAVGVGQYAEARAREALAGLDLRIGRVLHPSPASPKANRGWSTAATRELEALGIEV